MGQIIYQPIGTIHTPFKDTKDMPIQAKGGKGIRGTIRIEPAFVEGLKDIEGFSHIILIYDFHRSKGYALTVKPFLDDKLRGVFATRAPKHPNPIGISVVKLKKVEGNILHIEDVDIVNGTPLLDMKPYIPDVDAFKVTRIGWLSKKTKRFKNARADGRFKS
jgi:tRNA-Thr(GGU) m(6)t(6)A37 methyltransferase TsaA